MTHHHHHNSQHCRASSSSSSPSLFQPSEARSSKEGGDTETQTASARHVASNEASIVLGRRAAEEDREAMRSKSGSRTTTSGAERYSRRVRGLKWLITSYNCRALPERRGPKSILNELPCDILALQGTRESCKNRPRTCPTERGRVEAADSKVGCMALVETRRLPGG